MTELNEFDPATLAEINGANNATDHPDYLDIDGVRYWREKPQMEVVDPMKAGVERLGYSRIVINLAPHAREIKIDNKVYTANRMYEIRDDQVPTFLEIMSRTWQHERAVGGANTNAMVGAHNLSFNLRTQTTAERRGPAGVPGTSL